MPMGKVSANTQWNLQVNSASTSASYSYDQLLAMPVTTVSANLACYGSPIANGDWSGVSLSYLLNQTGLDLTTASVNFVAADGYKVSLSLEEAMQSDVIIAYQINGASLPETLRLVLPKYNGNMWISMIASITMSSSTAYSGTSSGTSSGIGITMPKIPNWLSSTPAPVQVQNTLPRNETITESTSPSTNVTQPTQNGSVQQESNSKDSGFRIEAIYGIALGATIIVLVVATIALIRRRNIRKSSSLSSTRFDSLQSLFSC